MYEYVNEIEFEAAWSRLLSEYNVHEKTWMISIYTLKEKWASCYMKRVFTLDMRSTQLNVNIKKRLKLAVDIIQFFKHFEQVMEDKRYKELKCEFDARQKLPRLSSIYAPMLIQLADIYTPTILDLFQYQFSLKDLCCVKQRKETEPLFEYVITMIDRKGEWTVWFHPQEISVSCSCKKFETSGILCCHVLKVFGNKDVMELPDQYILKRWTKEAKVSVKADVKRNEVEKYYQKSDLTFLR